MEPCNGIPIFKTGELKEREREGRVNRIQRPGTWEKFTQHLGVAVPSTCVKHDKTYLSLDIIYVILYAYVYYNSSWLSVILEVAC